MKKLIEIETIIKTNRRIDIEKIEGTDFAYYTDTREINTDGNVEVKTYHGITSLENLKSVKGLKKIADKVFAPKMYEGYACVAAINKQNFKDVLIGKKHISEVIEDVSTLSFPISNDWLLVLWNWGSYKIADLNYDFISIPIHLNYINGGVDNEKYDLDKLLKKLKEDEHVINRENLKITNIPYYNAEEERDQTIDFLYLFDKEDYQKVAKMSSLSLEYYVLDNIIQADDCRKIIKF